jgi:hypothetical protein
MRRQPVPGEEIWSFTPRGDIRLSLAKDKRLQRISVRMPPRVPEIAGNRVRVLVQCSAT